MTPEARYRAWADDDRLGYDTLIEISGEMADEIERLRAQLAELKRGLTANNSDSQMAFLDAHLDHYKTLRNQLAEAQRLLQDVREWHRCPWKHGCAVEVLDLQSHAAWIARLEASGGEGGAVMADILSRELDDALQEIERLRAQLAEALAWRTALDELHVTNWVGVIEGLTPQDAVRLLLERALDQDRDVLRAQLAATERERDLLAKDAGRYAEAITTMQGERDVLRAQLAEAQEALANTGNVTPIARDWLARDPAYLSRDHQRIWDLVRYARGHLLDMNLITRQEYSVLLGEETRDAPNTGSPSPRRLESYDEIRAQLAEAQRERDEARRCLDHMVPLSNDGTSVFIDGVGPVPLDFRGRKDV